MTKKEILIQQAEELLLQKGYQQTGINELLSITKLSKGTLYYYFPKGKEEIFGLALQNLIDQELRIISNICTGKVIVALKRLIKRYSQEQNQENYPFVFSHIYNDLRNETSVTLQEKIKEFQTAFLTILAVFLREKKVSNPKRKARQFYMLMIGFIQMNDILDDKKHETALEELIERIY
ncbi:MAG: TetR/AcrR family transcriptional regulator [Flavobacteriales bacterium]|jgi:AcrR family transcriptional regulator|nr:TetR/AcrR family transcriptional regulator [Flavobacteriales bacterium]